MSKNTAFEDRLSEHDLWFFFKNCVTLSNLTSLSLAFFMYKIEATVCSSEGVVSIQCNNICT